MGSRARRGAQAGVVIITLTGGAAGATDYPRQLVADLQSQLRADADALLEAGVDAVLWEQAPDVHTFPRFLRFLRFVKEQLPVGSRRTVVFLHPKITVDESAFLVMLEQTLRGGQLPSDQLIMVQGTTSGAVYEASNFLGHAIR